MSRFEGKTVLVTGAGSGIGRAVASAFAAQGASVVICGRNAGPCEETASIIAAAGAPAPLVVAADIGVESDVARLFCHVRDTAGSLDVAVFNAGVGFAGSIADQPLIEFEAVMRTNTIGLWLCLKNAIRMMIPQGGGSIVNTLSVHATRTIFPGTAAYTASKHAALALTKAAAVEAAPHGIRVNAVAPGPVMTDMLARSVDVVGGLDGWAQRLPQKRIGEPGEVAAAIMWLAGEGASFVTGAVLPVDGGYLAT